MVESAANSFLESFRDLLVEEAKFLLSVSSEVDQVKRDLRRMHALLMKADRESRESPSLNLCMEQLTELASQAESTLERYAAKVQAKRLGRELKDKLLRYICIMSECYTVHHIGRDAQDITSGLAELTRTLEREFGQETSSHAARHRHQFRQTFANEVVHHFVGMEEDIDALLSMLNDQTRRKRVLKIYGMGGLGKTTLARKVYNHRDVQSYARAWVCVTQHFEAKAVLGNILGQLDSNDYNESMDVTSLVLRIQRFLKQRELCLVVIDDIWEDYQWEIIKPAFPSNCNVLLTTRSQIIATPQSEPYHLELLTQDEGWELLQEIALPRNLGPGMESFETIGREIVVKCGRLPLAISVMGGILYQKEEHSLAKWKKVNEKMDSYLRRVEGSTEYTRVKQVLDLGYDGLPYYLKPCFLYLACLSKDEGIKTEKLYRMWMAEGFISHQDKERYETLRDVAERYLTELAMRCMVQVRKDDNFRPNHKFDSCHLHDLMHDLCSSKAEEVNHVKRIDPPKYLNGIPPSIGNSTRRLAITFDWDIDLSGIKGLQELNLRSFMVLKENERIIKDIPFKDDTISFDKSQSLRILMLDGCEFEEGMLPSKVADLIHLRYLSLVGSHVRELPKFVCSMPYLQTLDLRVQSIWTVLRLPDVIWKMKRLRHLSLPCRMEVIGGGKLKLDGLKELETLDGTRSKTVCVADIPTLTSLVELDIFVDDMDSMAVLAHHMANKGSRLHDTHLTVTSCDFSCENGRDVLKNLMMSPSLVTLRVEDCKMRGGFPEYDQGMGENLLYLKLHSCEVRGDVMGKLGKYPMLQHVKLEGEEIGMEEALICPSNSFPELNFLCLNNLPSLKKWQVEKGALPKLTMLEICCCINLEKVPDGLRFITTLRRLDIANMPNEFNERVRGQDNATVSHIQSLCII